MNTLRRKPGRAFTLIELLLGVVIVSLIGSIALPQVHAYREKNREAEILAKMNECRRGVDSRLRQIECAERLRRLSSPHRVR